MWLRSHYCFYWLCTVFVGAGYGKQEKIIWREFGCDTKTPKIDLPLAVSR